MSIYLHEHLYEHTLSIIIFTNTFYDNFYEHLCDQPCEDLTNTEALAAPELARKERQSSGASSASRGTPPSFGINI